VACDAAVPRIGLSPAAPTCADTQWCVRVVRRPESVGQRAGTFERGGMLRPSPERTGSGYRALKAAVEALLAGPGAREHGGVLVCLAARELVGDLRAAAGVPGGLDQQPPGVGVAGPS